MDPKSVIRKSTKEVKGQEFKCGMVPRGPFVNSLFPRRMRIMEGGSDKENEEKKKKEDEGPVRKQKWTSRGDRNKTF